MIQFCQKQPVIQINIPKEYDEIGFAVDGQVRFSLNAQTKINVNCAKHYAKLVRLPEDMYFKTLRSKMGWFGNLYGDIKIIKSNYGFYFPITSMIIISLTLTIVFNIFSRFFK